MGTTDKQLLQVVYTDLGAKLDSQVKALPKSFNKARFMQNCMTVLQDGDADFRGCKPESVVRTLLKGAFMSLDFFNGECYAIPYKGDVKFQTDYKGEKKLVKKYSIRKIKDLYSKVVRDGDEFVEKIEDGEQKICFYPKAFNNGEIVGAFSVVLYEDGGMDYETMSKEEIEDTRQNFSKAPNSPAWKNSYGEMCKKTVLRRLCKHIEIDFETSEMQQLFESESDFDVNKKPEAQEVPNIFDDVVADVEAKVVEEPVKYTQSDIDEMPFK